MQKVVLDSNIIIDYTRGFNSLFRTLLSLHSNQKIDLYIPSVVVTELMIGKETKDEKKLEKLEDLISEINFIEMNYRISRIAGFLLRDLTELKLGDAFIAATTLFLNAKLATRNIKDFQTVKDLRFFKTK